MPLAAFDRREWPLMISLLALLIFSPPPAFAFGSKPATNPSPPALSVPSGFTATALSTSQIRLSWSFSGTASGFQVDRSFSSSFGTFTQISLGASTRALVDTGLNPGTLVYYRIRTIGGAHSSLVHATTFLATSGGLAPPARYQTNQLIFEDRFLSPTLDSQKWIPQIADQFGIWRKNVPAPFSAPDMGGFDAEFFDPAQVITGSGLKIRAQRDNRFSGYSWRSGCITTHGLFKFQGGYVQIRAKMPDSSSGMWGGLWFLEGGGEIDLQESGYTTGNGAALVNNMLAMNLHSGSNSQKIVNTGVDLSSDYHVYGMEYVPGVSVRMYLDGALKAEYTQNVPTGAYTILINLQVAQKTAGWHSVANAATPSPSILEVSDVQVYRLKP